MNKAAPDFNALKYLSVTIIVFVYVHALIISHFFDYVGPPSNARRRSAPMHLPPFATAEEPQEAAKPIRPGGLCEAHLRYPRSRAPFRVDG